MFFFFFFFFSFGGKEGEGVGFFLLFSMCSQRHPQHVPNNSSLDPISEFYSCNVEKSTFSAFNMKTINFGGKLSFILSFHFPQRLLWLLLHIFIYAASTPSPCKSTTKS
jgi:hypothetical protein